MPFPAEIDNAKSYELSGVKQSFATHMTNVSPELFPFQTMLTKFGVTRALFEWLTDADEPVDQNNAQMEGFDYNDINQGYAPAFPMRSYAQIMAKAVKVTASTDAQQNHARGKESGYQENKKIRALKRDLEWVLLSDQQAAAEVKDVSPRRMAGYLSMVSSVDNGVTRMAHPNTGDVTYIEAAAAKPTATDIFNCMAALRRGGCAPKYLMCSDTMLDVISGMQEGASRNRIFENTEKVTFEVNTITDNAGVTVRVIINDLMPPNCVYLFDPAVISIAMFRQPASKPVAETGDYKQAVFVAELGLMIDNPWGVGAVVPSGGAVMLSAADVKAIGKKQDRKAIAGGAK